MKNPFLTLVFILLNVLVVAQNSTLRFQHININDGLSLSSVYCVFRDSKGYMWFGTEDGLNRFDGYHFEIFRSDINNSNSICYKWIESIAEDSQGHLWFGSRKGLSCYNPARDVFVNYSSYSQYHPLTNDTVTCLYAICNSVLVGTCNGLVLIDVQSLQSQLFQLAGRVNFIDHKNDSTVVWIGTDRGLYQLDLVKQTLRTFILESNFVAMTRMDGQVFTAGDSALWLFDRKIQEWKRIAAFETSICIESMEPDRSGNLWIGASDGLYRFTGKNKRLIKIINAVGGTNSLAINISKVLFKDKSGLLWYGTHGSGLYVIDGDEISLLKHNPLDPYSLSQNQINCIYQDRTNDNIWLGTFGAGLNIFNPNSSKFELLKHNPLLPDNSLSSNFIWSVFEASDGWLWIGTNDKGITCYKTNDNEFLFFDVDNINPNASPNSSVREIYEDRSGTIWVGTDGGGLCRFDGTDKGFTVFTSRPGNDNSLSDNSVRVIFEDSKSRLWIGTRNGFNRFDREKGSFKRFMNDKSDSTSISHNFVYSSIIEDYKGYLWIGTYGGGLNRFDPDTEIFTHYNTTSKLALYNDIIFAIYQDKDSCLWIGTNEGLNHLNQRTGEVQYMSTMDGLPNEVVYSILPDDKGFLWLSTNKGICCFNPRDGTTRNFDINDGLQSNEFNGGAFHKGKSGKLYFGGVYGLNIIQPGQIALSSKVNRAVFTRLDVMGTQVQTNHLLSNNNLLIDDEGQLMLGKNISYLKNLTLPYARRFFSLEFTGMNHLFPDKTQYAFQLYPLNKEWNYAGNRNFVSYANIKPGKYVFRVKCTNTDGVWNEVPAELHVNIRPPFWMSSWFIAIEMILLLVLAVFVHRYLVRQKTNKLLLQQNEVIKEANRRLKDSENHLLSLNATKDKFFSIISHDLKNPFTSLMSISEMLTENYDTYDKEDRKTCVNRMHHSIKQIYTLLENLLTWSRSQRGKISFEAQYFDLAAMINENINLYRLQAEKKDLSLDYKGPDKLIAYANRNSINTVIRNLLGNAVKFTHNKGCVEVSLIEENSGLKIFVKDSGVGMSEETIKKLFLIDQKINTEGTHGEKGTGLGLIICKEFIEKNGGDINVNSKPDKGSEFWFTIPKKQS